MNRSQIIHHPKSINAVIRLRLAAVLFAGNCVFAVVAAGLLVHSLMIHNRGMMMIGSGVAVLVFILIIVQWIAAMGSGCPLCRTPVLAPKRCVKHRKARTLLGSHRLRVAVAILLKNGFRCPYCNESTGMELRETGDRSPLRKSHMH
jgi:predicted membrane-bound spermidine synthase